jgi:hypothetical protein
VKAGQSRGTAFVDFRFRSHIETDELVVIGTLTKKRRSGEKTQRSLKDANRFRSFERKKKEWKRLPLSCECFALRSLLKLLDSIQFEYRAVNFESPTKT